MRLPNSLVAAVIMSLSVGQVAAADGYKIAGRSGLMTFVSVDPAHAGNEDIYRYAVGESCGGKAVCQVMFWVGKAPKALPMTDAQVDAKLVHWQQNLNTGLRRWLVKCDASDLFRFERECM